MREDWTCDGCGERVTREGNIRARELRGVVDDLVRALLAVEWAEGGHCPSCGSFRVLGVEVHGAPKHIGGHETTCALDAALRKAGVRG